jgi:hypothetical protein
MKKVVWEDAISVDSQGRGGKIRGEKLSSGWIGLYTPWKKSSRE